MQNNLRAKAYPSGRKAKPFGLFSAPEEDLSFSPVSLAPGRQTAYPGYFLNKS